MTSKICQFLKGAAKPLFLSTMRKQKSDPTWMEVGKTDWKRGAGICYMRFTGFVCLVVLTQTTRFSTADVVIVHLLTCSNGALSHTQEYFTYTPVTSMMVEETGQCPRKPHDYTRVVGRPSHARP